MKKLPALLLLPLGALAQSPSLVALTPSRHLVSAPRTQPLGLSFTAPVSGAGLLSVQGNLWQGRRSGRPTGDGSPSLGFQPTKVFAPGEKVSLSVPPTIRGTGAGTPPVVPGVYQFQAAAGPATGTFTALPRQNGPRYIFYHDPKLADFNNDGRLDLLIGTANVGNTEVRLGDGHGHFEAVPSATFYGNGLYNQVADFNEDGNLDVVISTVGSNGSVLWLGLGNGQGQFNQTATSYSSTSQMPLSVQVGDFNGDGHQDYLFALAQFGGPSTRLEIRLGNGQGQFTAAPGINVPTGVPTLLQTGDLNNDGKTDLLVADAASMNVLPYLGDGQGSFTYTGLPTALGPARSSIWEYFRPGLADLNADHILDLLLVNLATQELELRQGSGNGSFGPATVLPRPAGTTLGVFQETADVDGDGDLDVLTQASAPGATQLSTVLLWRNNGAGQFGPPAAINAVGDLLATGDLNNDGTIDLVSCDAYNGGYLNVRLNQPLASGPAITGFTPAMATPGTVVTLTGSNFTGATTLLLGGVPFSGFSVVNNGTAITFTVPAGISGGLLTVITPSGQATTATPLLLPTATPAARPNWAVAIYPNPARGKAMVQVPGLPGGARVQISLYNGLGQRVRQYPGAALPAPGLSAALDVQGLAPGLYTLRLAAGGTSVSKKLAIE